MTNSNKYMAPVSEELTFTEEESLCLITSPWFGTEEFGEEQEGEW